MARLPRLVAPGQLHLVVQRSRTDRVAIAGPDDERAFVAALVESRAVARVAVHAWGLGSDEVRLLLTPETGAGLATLMQDLGRRFVPDWRRRHGADGTPWAGRFRSTVVEADRWFDAVLRHVEAAAGPAGDAVESATATVSSPVPVPRSSLRHHLGLERVPWLVEHPARWRAGNTPFEREAARARLLAAGPAPQAERDAIERALNGWVLGSDAYAQALGVALARRVTPLPPGRRRAPRV